MKNKKLVFVLILIFIIIITFFCIPKSKKIKIGNNNSNQEIIQNILNISSYETEIELEVNSNKNKNKYIIKQKYEYPDISEQEIMGKISRAKDNMLSPDSYYRQHESNYREKKIAEEYKLYQKRLK